MVSLKRVSVLFLWMCSFNLQAKDFGVVGHTFKIIESDLLAIIQQKLNTLEKTGGLIKHQTLIQQKTMARIKEPQPVLGLIKTKQHRLFEYHPTILVSQDLKDHQGHVWMKAGTRINPLEVLKLSKKLIFIDGRDSAQVEWALQQPLPSKIILVNGSPFALSEQHVRSFYFDQSGLLTKKLQITQVPAQVFQDNKVLKIEEVLLEKTS